jgi:hypothetical protein
MRVGRVIVIVDCMMQYYRDRRGCARWGSACRRHICAVLATKSCGTSPPPRALDKQPDAWYLRERAQAIRGGSVGKRLLRGRRRRRMLALRRPLSSPPAPLQSA